MTDILKHLDLNSADGTRLNIDALYQIVPSAFTEVRDDKTGEISRKVNFEVLRRLLGDHATDGDGEMYQFTWVGKNAARAEAAKPTDKTLRPVPEDSVDWDNSKNVYIEGDNLEVLKLLQRSFMGKVKMIYIDPPYNTGRDFIYPDKFLMDLLHYNDGIDYFNENHDINFARPNSASNARFHSDWCSMMYDRLLVARNLLSDDGVIMISIDESEQGSLREICDEVFGFNNFVECLVYDKKAAPKGVPPVNMIVGVHEYIYCYAKNTNSFSFIGVERSSDGFSNPDNDPRGPWRNTNLKSTTSEKAYEIIDPATGHRFLDTWAFAPNELQRLISDGRIIFPKSETGQVRAKEYFNEFSNRYIPIKSSLGLYDAQWNTEMLTDLMGGQILSKCQTSSLNDILITSHTSK